MSPTPDQQKAAVKQWLKAIGKDRQWLADQTGYARASWNNWLSEGKELPAHASRVAELLMAQHGLGQISLTLDEWSLIDEAAHVAGFDDVQSFICTVLREKADSIRNSPALKVAEDPIAYKSSQRRPSPKNPHGSD